MTSIEWVKIPGDDKPGLSVNPIRARDKKHPRRVGHFCERISPGCAHCYASTWQRRFKMYPYEPQYRDRIEFFLDEKVLAGVSARKQPTAYFWEDMSDLFGDWVPDKWLDACFETMAATPRHFHMVLTKRPERMRAYMERLEAPIFRVMLGTSFENQATADARLPELLKTPAWQRFVSYEPALGRVRLQYAACTCPNRENSESFRLGHRPDCALYQRELCSLLNLVIYGGESGAGARPNSLVWAAGIIDQCKGHRIRDRRTGEYTGERKPDGLRIPVFIKQLGAFPTDTRIDTEEFARYPVKVVKLQLTPAHGRKRPATKGNDPEEWPPYLRVREL